jgi:hypothetical protein
MNLARPRVALALKRGGDAGHYHDRDRHPLPDERRTAASATSSSTPANRSKTAKSLMELVGRTGFEPVTNGLKAGPRAETPTAHNKQQQSIQESSKSGVLSIAVQDGLSGRPVVPNLCRSLPSRQSPGRSLPVEHHAARSVREQGGVRPSTGSCRRSGLQADAISRGA